MPEEKKSVNNDSTPQHPVSKDASAMVYAPNFTIQLPIW
jgi:hypothetical protein